MSYGRNVQPLPASGFNAEQRLRRIETALWNHITIFGGHTIKEGFHQQISSVVTSQYIIWTDPNRVAKKYEEIVKYNVADPAKIESTNITYWDVNGNIREQYVYTNYVYDGAGTLLSFLCKKVV